MSWKHFCYIITKSFEILVTNRSWEISVIMLQILYLWRNIGRGIFWTRYLFFECTFHDFAVFGNNLYIRIWYVHSTESWLRIKKSTAGLGIICSSPQRGSAKSMWEIPVTHCKFQLSCWTFGGCVYKISACVAAEINNIAK